MNSDFHKNELIQVPLKSILEIRQAGTESGSMGGEENVVEFGVSQGESDGPLQGISSAYRRASHARGL